MAAPVHTTKETLIVPRRPLEKASSSVVCIFSIAKILFVAKQCETEFQNRTRANLVLVNREARVSAPSGSDFKPKNQWAALCAAHDLSLKKPKSFIVVYLYNQRRKRYVAKDYRRRS